MKAGHFRVSIRVAIASTPQLADAQKRHSTLRTWQPSRLRRGQRSGRGNLWNRWSPRGSVRMAARDALQQLFPAKLDSTAGSWGFLARSRECPFSTTSVSTPGGVWRGHNPTPVDGSPALDDRVRFLAAAPLLGCRGPHSGSCRRASTLAFRRRVRGVRSPKTESLIDPDARRAGAEAYCVVTECGAP